MTVLMTAPIFELGFVSPINFGIKKSPFKTYFIHHVHGNDFTSMCVPQFNSDYESISDKSLILSISMYISE